MRWRCHDATDFPCASIGLDRKTHAEAFPTCRAQVNRSPTGAELGWALQLSDAIAARLARRISTLCQLKHIAFRIGPIAEWAGEARVGLDAAHRHAFAYQLGSQLFQLARN